MGYKIVSFMMDEDLKKKLDVHCCNKDLSIKEFIAKAIEEKLNGKTIKRTPISVK